MSNNSPSLLEKELSYKIQGIFIDISKEFGYLYKEKVYQNILKEKFQEVKIFYQEFPNINIYNIRSGKFIGNYCPDFLIEHKIILEIKAQSQLFDTHINQLIRYLNSSKYEIGYLVNFGTPKAQIIRRVYSNVNKSFLFRQ